MQSKAVFGKKSVVAQARHVDHIQGKACHVCIPLNVVEIVHRINAGEKLPEPDKPAGLLPIFIIPAGHLDEISDLPRIHLLAPGKCSGRAPGNPSNHRTQLPDDDPPANIFMGQPPAAQVMFIKKMPERAMADIVEQSRQAQQFFHIIARRHILAGVFEAWIKVAGKLTRHMHSSQGMLKAGMLGRRVHPSRALQLINTSKPLHPGGIDNVLFRLLRRAVLQWYRERGIRVNRIGNQCHPGIGSGRQI